MTIEQFSTVFSHVLTLAGSSAATLLIQYFLQRRKARAEADGAVLANQSVQIQNMRENDEYWQGLLSQREDMNEKVYTKLITYESTMLEQSDLIMKLQRELADCRKKETIS